MNEQQNRTEQLILDTSKREAELLLRNSELTHEVRQQRRLCSFCLSLSDKLA